MAHALGQPCATETGLREQCFGVFEGLRAADIQAQHPDAWQHWLKFDAHYAVEGADASLDNTQPGAGNLAVYSPASNPTAAAPAAVRCRPSVVWSAAMA